MAHSTATKLACCALLCAAVSGSLLAADKKAPAGHFNIPLWEPGKVPLASGNGPLDNPFLTVFLPPPGKGNGSSVILAPGGSNIMLMYGAEGVDIAERYNDWGAAAFVLTYRLGPKYRGDARALDGKRAMQIVRSRAAEWKLDPNKIGLAGFSAGSELARAVAAAPSTPDPNAADPLDRVSSRPDYLLLVYSAGRPNEGEVLKNFPPSFLLSAAADRGPANSLSQLFIDLNRAGADAELHIYQKGRHGFGAAFSTPGYSGWMDVLKNFLVQGGFLPEAK